jgi:hypothetical protein
MNKRIKELLEEATLYVHERTDDDTPQIDQDIMLMERLIELAVNDCADIADKNHKLGIPLGTVMKQYFGFA